MEQSRNAYRVLVGKPEERGPSGRPRRRREDNIKVDLKEVGCDARYWMVLLKNRDHWQAYVIAIINFRVP